MQVLYSSLHNLDLNQDEPVRKEIPSDFGSFMQSYIEFATSTNDTSREYTVRDKNRTVVSCLSDLFSDVLKQGDIVTDSSVIDAMADSIALKLLDSEKTAQPIKTARVQFEKLRCRMIRLWVTMIIGLAVFTGLLYMNSQPASMPDSVVNSNESGNNASNVKECTEFEASDVNHGESDAEQNPSDMP